VNSIQDELMDELYFLTTFSSLCGRIEWTDDHEKALISLLRKGFVNQLAFDNHTNDFVKRAAPDIVNLHRFSYLASKKGLLAHSGM